MHACTLNINMCLFNTALLYQALDLFFINDTPRLHGGASGSVFAQFTSNRQNIRIRCRLRGYESGNEDCEYNSQLSSHEKNVCCTCICMWRRLLPSVFSSPLALK